jgi:hypothetical protein
MGLVLIAGAAFFDGVGLGGVKPAQASLVSSMTTPEGLTINVYVSSVTAQQVYDWLKAAGLQDHVKLTRVDIVETGMTKASVGGGCYPETHSLYPKCWANNASIQINEANILKNPNFSIGHEYGHVWSTYYRWTVWRGSWDAYLEARGLLGDSRLGSTTCWTAAEMIAEDYRRLFGAGEALTMSQCVRDIPAAMDVPGLRDFLALTWTDNQPPPAYSGGSPLPPAAPTETATPTPSPTETAAPAPSPTNTPEPTPTPDASEPTPTKGNGNGKGNGGGSTRPEKAGGNGNKN